MYNANGGSKDPSTYFAYEGTDFTSNAELPDAIRLERRVELAFGGKRKHDSSASGRMLYQVQAVHQQHLMEKL